MRKAPRPPISRAETGWTEALAKRRGLPLLAEPAPRSSPTAREDNGMMEVFGQPELLVAGCAVLAALTVAAREVAAGLLRAVGSDLWAWLKRHRPR